MTNIEMVEKLREKANVSYADAKDALERASWDLLDAMILLEKDGKVHGAENARQAEYSTKSGSDGEKENSGGDNYQKRRGTSFSELLGKFFRWFGKLIKLGNANEFIVEKQGEAVLTLPVTVLALLLIIGFVVVIPLLVIGLFFGFRYYFTGPNLGRDDINNAMDKASDVAENIKDEFSKGSGESK